MHHGKSPSPTTILFLIAFALCSTSVASTDDEATDEPSTDYDERVEVLADETNFESVPLDLELLETGRTPNIAVALTTLAGVAGVNRSLNSYEPVIHGMGWERVQTQVNGMPLYGACPARMDPPAFLLGSAAASEVEVVKGLASVTLGPAGTGGRIAVTTDHDRGIAAGREVEPWVRAAHDGATGGFRGGAGVRGGTDQVDYALGLEYLDQGDYNSAGGLTVPAGQTDSSGFVSFGHRPTETQRWSVGAIRHEGEAIAYPSLPMDTDNAETSIFSGGYRYQSTGGGAGLSAVELKLGYSSLDHRMSNRERTNRLRMQAESVSEAGTWSLGVATRWLITPRSLVRGGFDLNALQRDALRRRHVTASGMTFNDHLWPDASQDDLGLYAEFVHAFASDWRLRAGLRYDDLRSEAAAADDPALGGGTIREAYVRFYGPQAAETDRDEGLVSGNVVVSKELGERVALQGGFGLAARAAGVTERYFAFAPAPNGFLVGNPSLDAERKRELSLGATFDGRLWSGAVSGYYYAIDDYILPVVLAEIDMNGDGTLDLVRGFENTDATLTGFDASFELRPSASWTFPVSLSVVRGEDDNRGVSLPEIPAAELRLAGRWTLPGRLPGWLELGGRFVAAQDRIDPAFGEDETPGYPVWHLHGQFGVARFLTLRAGVENLFDRDYWEHLTREAASNVPGLVLGQEIPQPGRFFTVALSFVY